MPDFNVMNPPRSITAPGLPPEATEYPKHLHRLHGAYCIVPDAASEAQKRSEGWYGSEKEALEAAQADPDPEPEPGIVPVKRGRPRKELTHAV